MFKAFIINYFSNSLKSNVEHFLSDRFVDSSGILLLKFDNTAPHSGRFYFFPIFFSQFCAVGIGFGARRRFLRRWPIRAREFFSRL